LFLLLVYPFWGKGKGGVCDVAKEEIVLQVPYSMEIVQARHPRTALSDKLADMRNKAYARACLDPRLDGIVNCYVVYYSIKWKRDAFHKSQADWMEKELGLN